MAAERMYAVRETELSALRSVLDEARTLVAEVANSRATRDLRTAIAEHDRIPTAARVPPIKRGRR